MKNKHVAASLDTHQSAISLMRLRLLKSSQVVLARCYCTRNLRRGFLSSVLMAIKHCTTYVPVVYEHAQPQVRDKMEDQ